MRLLADPTPPATKKPDPRPAATGGDSAPRKSRAAKAEPAPAPAAPAVPAVDYTRPTSTTELLLDLQRRVIALEGLSSRKLTAGEFAIAVEATTGMSVERMQKLGTVVEKCNCGNLNCKGWRLIPVEHYRTAKNDHDRNNAPVTAADLKDVPVTAVEEPEPDWDALFEQMFTDGLLKRGKGGATLIPKDGPVTWTHQQQLAFAHGFEMEELTTLEGKPRELQRRLIAALKEIGYDIASEQKG